MIGFTPRRPTGSDSKSVFMQWVWDKLSNETRQVSAPGALISRTTRGVIVAPSAQSVPPQPGGASVSMFVITSLAGGSADYVNAKQFDGAALSGSEVKIAKPPRQRPSVASEVIDGVTITYSSYTDDNNRTASDGTHTEAQVIFPRYVASATAPAANHLSVIFATEPVNGTGVTVGGTPVTWLEISPARIWARKYS